MGAQSSSLKRRSADRHSQKQPSDPLEKRVSPSTSTARTSIRGRWGLLERKQTADSSGEHTERTLHQPEQTQHRPAQPAAEERQPAQNTAALPADTGYAPEPEPQELPEIRPQTPIMPSPTTVPCQYRTGKTLGSGTYAIVKEAVHIKTGKYYACKVINKKLMEGREYMVRNEIAVLKRVSKGHRNIVTLHDYFETAHNLYLCFDLCTGGELFDRICAKGNYYEADAAELIRTIFEAVKYIHGCGIVHRDLKPENLLFRTKDEDADIMIADFGLSRVMEEEKLQLLTEICGTPGYMAPEIFKKTGHGKPVDVWAMGVITYFLLCGYTPFDRDTQQQEMEAIIAGDYKFEPEEYWANVSETARDFVSECLTIDPASRPTCEEALRHKWLSDEHRHFVPDPESPHGGPTDLLPHIQKHFDAKKTFRKAVFSMMAMKRFSAMAGLSPTAQALEANLAQYKEESEKDILDGDRRVVHYDQSSEAEDEIKRQDDADGVEQLANTLSSVGLDEKKDEKK